MTSSRRAMTIRPPIPPSTPEIYLNDQHGNLVAAGAIYDNMQGTDVAPPTSTAADALDVIFDTTSGKAFVFHNDGHAHFTCAASLRPARRGPRGRQSQRQHPAATDPRQCALTWRCSPTTPTRTAMPSVSAVGTSGIGASPRSRRISAASSTTPATRGREGPGGGRHAGRYLQLHGFRRSRRHCHRERDRHGDRRTTRRRSPIRSPTRAAPNTAFLFQFAANTFNDIDPGDTLTYSATLQDDRRCRPG